MSQSDLSKAERCSDPKLSTVRSLVEGLGLELRLVATDPTTGAAHEIVAGAPVSEAEGIRPEAVPEARLAEDPRSAPPESGPRRRS